MVVYLREYRERARLTRQQVADRLGVQPPAVYKWEHNINSPSLRDAERLADAYGILPHQLFVAPTHEPDPPDRVSTLEFFAKTAGVSPAAWLHIGRDSERLSEADSITRLLHLWDTMTQEFKAHWLAIAALQVAAQHALDSREAG